MAKASWVSKNSLDINKNENNLLAAVGRRVFLIVLIQLDSICILTFDGNKPALNVFSKLANKALLHVELFQESLKKNIDSDF